MFAFTEEEMARIIEESEKLDRLDARLRKEMQAVDEYPDMEERYVLMEEAKDALTAHYEVLANLVADFVRAHKA